MCRFHKLVEAKKQTGEKMVVVQEGRFFCMQHMVQTQSNTHMNAKRAQKESESKSTYDSREIFRY